MNFDFNEDSNTIFTDRLTQAAYIFQFFRLTKLGQKGLTQLKMKKEEQTSNSSKQIR